MSQISILYLTLLPVKTYVFRLGTNIFLYKTLIPGVSFQVIIFGQGAGGRILGRVDIFLASWRAALGWI